MKKEAKLINKVKRLLKRLGCPRWLHHFGPKKYEFWKHALALIVKQECRLGYRRVSRLLNWLGFDMPTYSALAKMFGRIKLNLWKKILSLTNNQDLNLVAIDASGMSRPLPSPYYYRRIDRPYPIEIPLKISIAVDTRTKNILSLNLRSKKAHDIKDARFLINNLPRKPNKIIADKGYDANWLHYFCLGKGIKTCIPVRDYGKTNYRNTLRKRLAKEIKKRTYGRREIVEATFKSFKCKFGASVSSVKFPAQRAEMYCRAITHNIIKEILWLFQRTLIKKACKIQPKPLKIQFCLYKHSRRTE